MSEKRVHPACVLSPGTASLWAVTSYFNPASYRRRLANYKVFRRHLELPLLTVEWSRGGKFELAPEDAEILIQCDGGDVMWQKERLINIAIRQLPASCTHVAWVDCDVVFDRKGFAQALVSEFERSLLVQLYDRVLDLEPAPIDSLARSDDWRRTSVMHERVGTGRLYTELRRSGGLGRLLKPRPEDRPFTVPSSNGFAWAAARTLLEACPLPDTWILGGGDGAYAYAAMGYADEHVRGRQLTPAHALRHLEQAAILRQRVDGRVSWLPGALLHLWHGAYSDREYRRRHALLALHDYDPDADLEPEPRTGVWSWSRRARDGELAGAVAAYFERRREDGSP